MRAAPESQPVLERRFEKARRMEDPEEAIHKAQQAVEVTPQDHPDLVDNQGRRFLPVIIINLRCVRREIFVFHRARFGLLGSLIGRSQRQGFKPLLSKIVCAHLEGIGMCPLPFPSSPSSSLGGAVDAGGR